MTEKPGRYDLGSSPLHPQAVPSFETQLKALPPAVRSVAESLVLRDMESAQRYAAQFLAASRGSR